MHPDRIPLLTYPSENCKLEALKNEKMLVPSDFTIGMLLANLRRDLQMEDEQSLFIYSTVNGKKNKILKTGTL